MLQPVIPVLVVLLLGLPLVADAASAHGAGVLTPAGAGQGAAPEMIGAPFTPISGCSQRCELALEPLEDSALLPLFAKFALPLPGGAQAGLEE